MTSHEQRRTLVLATLVVPMILGACIGGATSILPNTAAITLVMASIIGWSCGFGVYVDRLVTHGPAAGWFVFSSSFMIVLSVVAVVALTG